MCPLQVWFSENIGFGSTDSTLDFGFTILF